MAFDSIAKSLLVQSNLSPSKMGKQPDLANHITALARNGFSPDEIFRKLSDLYDDCETDEKGIRLQILKLTTQIHGMLSSEEVKPAPSITIVVNGDNTRINQMLCPNLS